MLSLSRKRNQKIVIETSEGPISVQVVSRVGNTFRIGITAPKDVPVYREEIYQKRLQEGQGASHVG